MIMKIFLLLALVFCTFKTSFAQVVISGEVQNKTTENVTVVFWKDFALIQDTLSIDKDKRFEKQYNFTYPMFVRIEGSVITPFFLVFPNENLHVKIDRKGIKLSGTASEYNSFFVKLLDEVKKMRGKADDNAITKYALDQSELFFLKFNHKEANKIERYNKASIITSFKLYPLLRKYNPDIEVMNILKSFIRGESPVVTKGDKSLWTYLDSINYNDEFLKYDHEHLNIMNNVVRILRFNALSKDSVLNKIDPYLIEKGIIKNIFKDTPFSVALLAFNLHKRIKSFTQYPWLLGGVDEFINEFEDEPGAGEYGPILLQEFVKTKASLYSLAPGAVAPKFKLKDNNEKTVALSDLKGKVVYLDIWASWCAPCRKEIPALKDLQEKYKERELEIVSISIDTKMDNWLKIIKDYKLGGIQLIDNVGSEKSKTARDYNVHGVPHFVLIDKRGKIVLPSAPRPSEPALLEKELDKLLSE